MQNEKNELLVYLLFAIALISGCESKEAEPTREPDPEPQLVENDYRINLGARQFAPQQMSPEALRERFAGVPAGGQHGLLQFKRVLTLEERREIEDAGIELITPLPGNTWLGYTPAEVSAEQLERVPLRWLGDLAVDDKLAASIRAKSINEYALRDAGKVEVLLKLFPRTTGGAVAAAVEQAGGTLIRDLADDLDLALASLPLERLADLAGFDGIRFIEPTMSPPADEANRARGHTGASAAQTAGYTGTGVRVGVIEGGHALRTHPDFGTRVSQGDAGTFTVGQHATMTMGMILGDGSQSSAHGGSSLQWRGIAPAATGLTYNFLGSSNAVTNYLGDVQDAIENDAVDVINNSWGDTGCTSFPYGSYAGRAPFLDGTVTGDFGRRVPIVFSAGNERSQNNGCMTNTTAPFANYGSLNHPKSAKNILAVGAIDSANDRMSSFSSWGPTGDGRIKPEVVASGVHNGTNSSGVSVIDNPFGSPTGAANQQAYRSPNDDTAAFMYAWYSQTSSAAAITSGSHALLLEAWRSSFPTRPDPLPSTYKALLVHTARDLDDATSWYNPGPDYASGYGVIQIDQAVEAIEKRRFREANVGNGETRAYYLVIPPGTAEAKITLAWDDPATIENANPTLINDLDLVVTDPGGTRRFPWTLDPANPANDAVQSQEDHAGNLEQVQVNNPASGLWEVSVVGTNVQDGPQLFSIVADEGPVRQPVDMVLALDVSSSMNSPPAGGGAVPTKLLLLQQSVELFLQTWSLHAVPGDRIGVVYFSTDLSTVPPASPLLRDLAANVQGVISHVNNSTASGCTAMAAALQEAFDSFDAASNNKRTIVMFTDGMQSINPFIGEDGNPARLKIVDVPAGSSPPLGAFRCSSGTAQTIAGNQSTPDGQTLEAQGVEIHTIGTGVSGANFVQLIERIAAETGAVHHFTSAPDTNLDLFFTNDLVQALKSNTLQIVRSDEGDLAPDQTQDIAFPVNATASNVTIALSWKGSDAQSSIDPVVRKPDGSAATPDDIKQGAHYTVMRFDRPASGTSFTGSWTARLVNAVGKPLNYQQSVIVDEGCFNFDLAHGRGQHFAGDRIHLTARLSEFGRPMLNAKDVSVRVTRPETSRTNLISRWLPRVHEQYLSTPEKAEKQRLRPLTELEERLQLLKLIPEFRAELLNVRTASIQLVDNGDKSRGDWRRGDGIYSGFLTNTAIVGSYDLEYLVRTSSACGPLERRHLAGLYVGTQERIDPDKSVVTAIATPVGVTISVTPTDSLGNLAGPGLTDRVHVEVEGGKPIDTVTDNFDGSYTQSVSLEKGADPTVAIWFGVKKGDPAIKARLSELAKGGTSKAE